MNVQTPTPVALAKADGEYLVQVAERVLGTSSVAATNARRLAAEGFDEKRIDQLIPWASVAVRWSDYVFKKVEADRESPDNFGLFVRRVSRS